MSTKTEGARLLMPKATAIWFIENTSISFEQIADFTGLHSIEIQALADEEVGRGIVGRNPVDNNEVTKEEIEKATQDQNYFMKHSKSFLPPVKSRSKGPKYTPVNKRGDKPDAIAYLLKHHPEISDAQIGKLIGTTKTTIQRVRDRSHPNSSAIKPRHPVDLGLCSYAELENATKKGLKALGKDEETINQQKDKILENLENQSSESASQHGSSASSKTGGFDFSNFMKSGTSTNN